MTKFKVTSIDKKRCDGMRNTIRYVAVMYYDGQQIDTFELLKTDGKFWAWCGDTISQTKKDNRLEVEQLLNDGLLQLSGTI